VTGGEAPSPEAAGPDPVPILEGLFTLPSAREAPRLLASRCTACGETFFPQRRFCARCSSPDLAEFLLGPGGRLYTYTVVYELFAGLDSFGPYAVGQVEMEGSLRVQGLITGCGFEALEIDMPLELTLLPLGTDEHGRPRVTYAFRPAQSKEQAP
jgi:uncharacterized OB-fold protein